MKNINLLSAVMLSALFTVSGSLWAMEQELQQSNNESTIELTVVNLTTAPYGFSIEGDRTHLGLTENLKRMGPSKILGQGIIASQTAQSVSLKIDLRDLDAFTGDPVFKFKALPLKPDLAFDPRRVATSMYPVSAQIGWSESSLAVAVVILPDGVAKYVRFSK